MWWGYERFPKSTPKKVAGGIKAQSKRGSFGESWWAKRWIATIESFDIGGRLQRGRSYARGGQVLSIDVATGKVTSKVQGSMPKPYQVSIAVAVLSESDWAKVISALAGQAVYAAKLLAGEMPSEIEQVAKDAGVSLFPAKANDLKTSCSCPDSSNPCKHIAAVYYLLAEQFDRDPFLLFRLRGLDRETLFSRLGAAAPVAATPTVATPVADTAAPVPTDPRAFWHCGEIPADVFADVSTPPVAAAIPKGLGPVPFWRGNERFLDAMEPVYQAAGRAGLTVCLGGTLPDTPAKAASVRVVSRRKRK
jgi:uncharacterized Zn finger protein